MTERMSDARWGWWSGRMNEDFAGGTYAAGDVQELFIEAKRAREREDGADKALRTVHAENLKIAGEIHKLRGQLESQDFDALHKANEEIARLRERLQVSNNERESRRLQIVRLEKTLGELVDARDRLREQLESQDFDALHKANEEIARLSLFEHRALDSLRHNVMSAEYQSLGSLLKAFNEKWGYDYD